jgi:membrane protease subunit HflK
MPEIPSSTTPPRRPRVRTAFGRLLQGRDGGPPDLDEMWRDFKRKLGAFFGVSRRSEPGSGGGGFQPDVKSAGIGAGLIAAIVVVVWMFSGSFIVREGQQAVVTFFGKYARTVDAGWGWRLPWPFEDHRIVSVTQLQTAEIGRNTVNSATGLRDSAMLTKDENIVDVRFNVQYRLKDARAYVFENNRPDDAVTQAAESAVRETVGGSTIDSVLYEQRDALAANLLKLIQSQLDKLDTGILVSAVNVEGVTVPEAVIGAFNEVVKAGADRDRSKNEGQAYAGDVIPRANGDAARLREDALAYRTQVIDAAEGDSDRFRAVLAEYQKAPAVTRDRMYLDAMRDVYANVTKVVVDTRGGSNVIALPIDKLLQAGTLGAQSIAPGTAGSQGGSPSGSAASAIATPLDATNSSTSSDARSRDNARSRDRDGR